MSFQTKHVVAAIISPIVAAVVPMLQQHSVDWWVVAAVALGTIPPLFVDSPAK